MTKLTLTIDGEDDAAALRVFYRAFEGITGFQLLGQTPTDLHLHTAGYTGSWDDGNYTCDVARFDPVCASVIEPPLPSNHEAHLQRHLPMLLV